MVIICIVFAIIDNVFIIVVVAVLVLAPVVLVLDADDVIDLVVHAAMGIFKIYS